MASATVSAQSAPVSPLSDAHAWDTDRLTDEVVRAIQSCRKHGQAAARHAWLAGAYLAVLHARLVKGRRWASWLRRHEEVISEDTARRYILLYERSAGRAEPLAGMTLTEAYAAFGITRFTEVAPATPGSDVCGPIPGPGRSEADHRRQPSHTLPSWSGIGDLDRGANSTSPRGMSGHEPPHRGRTEEWLTPRSILDALGPFDLDPCSPTNRPWDTARRHFTEAEDGLSLPWDGRVYLNPPYGPQTSHWLAKMAAHGDGIVLTFARTDALWFNQFVWGMASALYFLRGRLRFCTPDGSPAEGTGGAPSVLIAYDSPGSDRNWKALHACDLGGQFVPMGEGDGGRRPAHGASSSGEGGARNGLGLDEEAILRAASEIRQRRVAEQLRQAQERRRQAAPNPPRRRKGCPVLHGDCLDLIPSLEDGSVGLVVTSPPYAEQRTGYYEGVPEAVYPEFTVSWMEALRPKLRDDGSVLIVIRPHLRHGVLHDYVLRTRLALRESGWNECEELIWYKPDAPPLGSLHRPRRTWESVLWYGRSPQPYCDLKACGRESDRLGFEGSLRFGVGGRSPLNGGQGVGRASGVARIGDVLVAPVGDNEPGVDHPAVFPLSLAQQLIKTFSMEEDLVLDPFCGSGQTLLAAKGCGRRYLGFEREERYVGIALERLGRRSRRSP